MKKETIQSNYDLQVDIAKEIFLKFDQTQIINKFCLDADERYIYIKYFNIPFRINRKNAGIDEFIQDTYVECRSFGTVMTIYDLLCYPKKDTAPDLLHEWCTIGTFVITGVQETDTFTKKYALLFDKHIEELRYACQKLGGNFEKPLAGADITCRFFVTPHFPILFQFWESDEEFPPQVLCTSTAHFPT